MVIGYSKKFLLAFAALATSSVFVPLPTRAQEPITRTIALSWNPSPSENAVGYRLYYGQWSGNYPHMCEMGDKTSGEVANLIEGTTYYFIVTAYDAQGVESDPSEEFHYMPNPALLLNVSARGNVQSDEGVMIVGFIVGGMGSKKMMVRGLGPSLAAVGISSALADPVLAVYGADGLLIVNDSWEENADEIIALGMAPGNSAEAAVALTLRPGAYTAVLQGKNGGTGVALLEVYDCGK